MMISKTEIVVPHSHDVLCGRGAGITKHPGNKRWRDLIVANRENYMSMPRNQRPLLAEEIVKAVRSLNPPGRFLSKDGMQLWYDIGDERAIEKTSQAMRDSKKSNTCNSNSKPDASPSTSPVTTATIKDYISIPNFVPEAPTNTPCSSTVPRERLHRTHTDSTFDQRLAACTFTTPVLERDTSTMSFTSGMRIGYLERDSVSSLPRAPGMPGKESLTRESTTDKQLQEFNVSIPAPLPNRQESGFNFTSFGTLPDHEFESLEAACEMLSAGAAMSQQCFSFPQVPNTTTSSSFTKMHDDYEPIVHPYYNYSVLSSDTTIPFDMAMMDLDFGNEDDHDMMMLDDPEQDYQRMSSFTHLFRKVV